MSGLRDDRASVIRGHYRALLDDFAAELPKLLDDLDAIDTAHRGEQARPGTGSQPPPGPVPPVPASGKLPKAPPAARTTTRRRA